jgi:hypothetical protein
MQLLLEAALLEKPRALASWRAFLAQNDLQTVDHAATTLLPLVYQNLQEESHPLCKSIYRHTWVSNQTLWARTLPTLHKLLDAGVEKIVLLKGMAMLLNHYPNFGVRVIGDIDILIDPAHLPRAYSTLIALGWSCKFWKLNLQKPSQFSLWHAANFIHPSGLHLDLHWSLLLECTPTLTSELLQHYSPGIQPANPTHLLFQTCVHGNKKSSAPLIRWIPDALTLLKTPIDFPALFALAQRTHLTLPLSASLSYLATHFNASIPPLPCKPTFLERCEFRANLRGHICLAAYFRSRLQKQPLFHYLQSAANLTSPWFIPLFAPYWVIRRLYRLAAYCARKCVQKIRRRSVLR